MNESSHSQKSEWDELEARSLISAEANGAQDTLPRNARQSNFRMRQIQVIFVLAICAVVAVFKEDIVGMLILDKEVNIVGKIPVEELRTLALEGKKDFDELVKKEYGEYADQLFDTVSVLRYFKTPNDVSEEKKQIDQSRERLKRRMKIKIIESQISEGTTTFTWVVGGHSAAAGHGNLFNQTYAYVIEQSLQGLFGSLGIKFYAKNFAMGGTKSSPEIALCMESLFGTDVDIVSWDYGMTDGRSPQLYNLWSQRAGIHSTRPMLFSYGQRYSNQIHKEVEDAGGAGFESNFADAKNIFPNSDDPNVDASTLPPAVKNYICAGHAETGEPCGDKAVKWDTADVCPTIGYQVSWHNGWKDHLFIGRVSAAFILETFLQALDELSAERVESSEESEESDFNAQESVLPNTKPAISSKYLAELHMYENKDRATFYASDPPSSIFQGEFNYEEFNSTQFQRSRSYCRSAVLPSQARYDGVVSGTGQSAMYLHGGRTDYEDEGYDVQKGDLPSNITEPYLAYNIKGNRNICKDAEIDFKDAFFVPYQEEWVVTSVPSDQELVYFRRTLETEGIVALCTVAMDWGRLPSDYIEIPDMYNATFSGEILVNDVKVNNGTPLDNDRRCFALKHDEAQSGYFFPKNDEGKYQIKFRLPRAGKLYLSSIIVL